MTVDLGDRKTYIGGSDVAAILGFSRWKTKLTVWMEKVGLLENKVDSIAADVGIELEDYVARRFTRETGIQIKPVPAEGITLIDKEKPYLIGHPDRETVSGDLVECKTTGEWRAKEWAEDEMPADYIMQVYYYMMLGDYELAHVPVLVGNNKFSTKKIIRDSKINGYIASMRKKLIDFWENYVIPKNMPMDITADDKDPLTILYPINNIPKMGELTDDLARRAETRDGYKQDLKKLEKGCDEIDNEFRAAIGSLDGLDNGIRNVTWKVQKSGGCPIDLIRFKNEQRAMYDKYLKKDNTSRVLRFSKS